MEAKTLEEANQTIEKLKKSKDKHYNEKIVAQARVYDLTYAGKEPPIDKELKAEIIYLRGELAKAIRKREYFHSRVNELEGKLKT